MIHKIVIEKKARKEADDIPEKYRASIDSGILSLASNPRPHAAKKLTEKEGYRIRSGNYRILYTISLNGIKVSGLHISQRCLNHPLPYHCDTKFLVE